jgi:hypothetical protein
MEAARLAFPPDAKESWDFEAGIAIDDQLQPVIGRLALRSASQGDSPGEASQLAPARAVPMRFDDVRAHFAQDREVSAVFETIVDRAAEQPYAEPALESRARARAITQLWRYLARDYPTGSEASLRVRTLEVGAKSPEAQSSQGSQFRRMMEILNAEDEKLVRSREEDDLRQGLVDVGWNEGEIHAMAAELLGSGAEIEAKDSDRPGPQTVLIAEARRSEAKRERKWIAFIALGAVALVSLWAWRSGNLDPPRKVAELHQVNGENQVAMDLRRRAAEDCATSRWKACVDELDQAKRMDPDGDRSPAVLKERQDAKAALASEQGSDP